jgi:hypothetical protein
MNIKNKPTLWIYSLSMLLFPVMVLSKNTTPKQDLYLYPPIMVSAKPSVALQAGSGASIEFIPQNGRTVDGVSPQKLNLPHLVLYRNGELTNHDERTLIVELSGIEVPPPGITVTLAIETMHEDPDLGGTDSSRISVLRESKWIPNSEAITHTDTTVTFFYEFSARVISGAESVPTPTDYFRYDIFITDNNHPVINPVHTFSDDFGFLMENQWIASLPEVQEEYKGAAPDELIVYYCDMYPFQNDTRDRSAWVPRESVQGYVESTLGPAMVAAYQMQSSEWGFTWNQAWTSYRSGEDAERLSVALTDGRTWFHGMAPPIGHAGISLKVKAGQYLIRANYDNLTDKLMSVFQHELFHNIQRNIELNNGGNGDLDGKDGAWKYFSEGTAVLASSVGKAGLSFSQHSGAIKTTFNAETFQVADIQKQQAGTNHDHAALYWRFLYEQCGGMKNGVEDTGAGMSIIKRTLDVLYSKEIVDIHTSSDLTYGMQAVMDHTLKDSTCPFNTYEESVLAFGQAITTLQKGSYR